MAAAAEKPVSNYDFQVDMARDIFLAYDQQQLIRKFHLTADNTWISLDYMNTPLRIHRASARVEENRGGLWQECRSFNTVMTVYDLLCYHKGPLAPTLTGAWCTSASFILTGVTNSEGFARKYADFFQNHTEELRHACQRLGGVPVRSMAGADISYKLPVTSFFPVLLQFWQADDEFPPKLMVMWDTNADQFLHFETTFYLQGDLLERLKACMRPGI